ncbi:MAG: tetratricopeptide repeat protein [Planctomycetia bacterium]|nr:tetratricopeptide repeat protein [Planctomycetia bacterium]
MALVIRKLRPLARVFARLATTTLVCVAVCSGCRNVPFYRMTSKASQSLPLSREGIIAYERGDFNYAEVKFEEALRLNDLDVETRRYYGETLWKQGKRAEAMATLTATAQMHGAIDAEASLYRSLAEKSLQLNDPEQARYWANKIVDLTPKSPYGWELRGKASASLGLTQEALEDFQRAAHFSVDDRAILLDVAQLQNQLGDFDSGLATWQCLERLYPTNREPVEVFIGKGISYQGLALYDQAQESFEVATRYAPENVRVREMLAEVALKRGDYERAYAVLSDVNVNDASNSTARELLALASQRRAQIAQGGQNAESIRK